jgi:hypothetical protein
MAPQRALKDDTEIAAVPLDKPVLIELPEGIDLGDDDLGNTETIKTVEKTVEPEEDDGAKKLQEQLDAALAAQKAEQERREAAEREAVAAQRIAAQQAAQADEARKRAHALESDVITGGLQAAQNELAAPRPSWFVLARLATMPQWQTRRRASAAHRRRS